MLTSVGHTGNELASVPWEKLKDSQLMCFYTSFAYFLSVTDSRDVYLKAKLFKWKTAKKNTQNKLPQKILKRNFSILFIQQVISCSWVHLPTVTRVVLVSSFTGFKTEVSIFVGCHVITWETEMKPQKSLNFPLHIAIIQIMLVCRFCPSREDMHWLHTRLCNKDCNLVLQYFSTF